MNLDFLKWFDFLNQPLPKLMTDPRFYGQAAHFLGGYSVLLTAALLSHSLLVVAVVWALFIAATAVKEFYYDTHFEIPVQDVKGGTVDFISYQAGATLAFLISLVELCILKG
jgi:hypothetical protein